MPPGLHAEINSVGFVLDAATGRPPRTLRDEPAAPPKGPLQPSALAGVLDSAPRAASEHGNGNRPRIELSMLRLHTTYVILHYVVLERKPSGVTVALSENF